MKCPHCGAEVPEGDRFCGECGKAVQAMPGPTPGGSFPGAMPGASIPQAAGPPQKKKRGIWLWIIGAVALIGLCVVVTGGAYVAFRLRPTPTATATATVPPTYTSTAMPTSTPTATFTATPTRAPAATPTPTAAPPTETATSTVASEAKVTFLVFAPAIDGDDNPVGSQIIYLPGTTEVFCWFEYEGFAGVTEYTALFYRDSADDVSGTLELEGQDSGQTWLRRYNEEGLLPGEYVLEISVQGSVIFDAEFVVLAGEIAWEDDFSSDAGGWTVGDTDTYRSWYENEELNILVKEDLWLFYATFNPGTENAFGDVAIEVDATIVDYPEAGGEIGIVTRRDGQDYYRFVISQHGFYQLQKHEEAGWTALTEWIESSAINQGAGAVNRLRVDCEGQSLRFYANGTFLDWVTDEAFASGEIGLSVGSYEDGGGVHAVFDNLVLYTLE